MRKIVRTRFAPSPTGFMHVGGARTALFSWLVARQAGGQFLLRIEDTDKAREVSGAEQHILDSLKWLGLNWDGEIYRQSEHLDTYRQWAGRLVEAGRAYGDPYPAARLDELRNQAKAQKKPFLFREHRPQNPPQWKAGQPLRFKSDPKAYTWEDAVLGNLTTGPEAVDDFIILKADGFPTYNFAHVIDDHLVEISHVIRTQEFLPSIPKFLNLYEALEIQRPILATLPYVMGPSGKRKLSKRDGAKDVLDYQRDGYLPEALINFLASLGWNDGTEQEIFSVDELKKKFSLGRVQKSGARFDEQRLSWMNGWYIRHLDNDRLLRQAKEYWPASADSADSEYKLEVLKLVKDRLKFFAELPALTNYFFAKPERATTQKLFEDPPDKQLKPLDKAQKLAILRSVSAVLTESNFSVADVTDRLNKLLGELQTKPAVVFPIIRIALTGSSFSPPIFETVSLLGKEEVADRLAVSIELLEKQA